MILKPALFAACALFCIQIIAGENPKDADWLFEYIKRGEIDKVREFINKDKAYLSCVSGKPDVLPLQACARRGKKDIAELLIKSGADVNARGGLGMTALMAAASNKNLEIVNLLLDAKANVNAVDENGMSVYAWALSGADELVIKRLMDVPGFDTKVENRDGMTPLTGAVSFCGKDVISKLIELGADVNHVTKAGFTPLHCLAASTRQPRDVQLELAKLLITKGADVNAAGSRLKATPLHEAAARGAVDLVKLFLSMKAAVDAQNESGMTPLHCACQADQVETATLLLDARADVKLVDKSNRTPYALTKEGSKTRALLDARKIKK